MRYLLDTGPLTAWLLGRSGALALIRPWIVLGEVATSVLVYGEVIEHLRRHPDGLRLQVALRKLLDVVVPLPLDLDTMDRYADLRLRMRSPYGPGLIGDIDTLIAATALKHNLAVVTTDGDFQRVPGLAVLQVARKTFVPLTAPSP